MIDLFLFIAFLFTTGWFVNLIITKHISWKKYYIHVLHRYHDPLVKIPVFIMGFGSGKLLSLFDFYKFTGMINNFVVGIVFVILFSFIGDLLHSYYFSQYTRKLDLIISSVVKTIILYYAYIIFFMLWIFGILTSIENIIFCYGIFRFIILKNINLDSNIKTVHSITSDIKNYLSTNQFAAKTIGFYFAAMLLFIMLICI